MSLDEVVSEEYQESIQRLSRDLRRAAATMSEVEARYLTDAYYIHQENRKRLDNQIKSMTAEPHSIIQWEATQARTMENQIKAALDIYSEGKLIGRWAKAHVGIGPVLAAGLLAHIDIRKAPTVGHIWRFGGMDPTVKWLPKTKRPWNAGLKVLCFKIGISFRYNQNRDGCVYGQEYAKRLEFEKERNERGDNAARAAKILTEKNFSKNTEAYKAYSNGKLPPAHINAQARRYAVKLFLSHMHFVWRFIETGQVAPKPYAIGHMDHTHFIPPQNIDMIDGLAEAMRAAGF